MNSLRRRVADIETKTGANTPRIVVTIEETDDQRRVTGCRFGARGRPDSFVMAREEGETLDALKARARKHAGPGTLMIVCFGADAAL